jgi:hypothetical protein
MPRPYGGLRTICVRDKDARHALGNAVGVSHLVAHGHRALHSRSGRCVEAGRTGQPRVMNDTIAHLLDRQSGVICRRQALAAGLAPHDIRRLLRRREWAAVHDGVYVEHTGPLSWQQRAWAAVLLAEPAALCHDSAIRAVDGPGRRDRSEDAPIHVAIDRHRKLLLPAGIVPHRLVGLDDKVLWNSGPPRVRIEHAVLDLAAEADNDFDAIAVISNAVQSRRTTAPRLLAALDSRRRIGRRAFLVALLHDVGSGACSVLEHGYLTRVERPHGLPRAGRQVTASARGPIYRDVEYVAYAMLVELDGRLFHDTAAARDRDLDRDLDAAVDAKFTVRLGWGQCFARPCLTAHRVGRLLQQRGWSGALVSCPLCAGDLDATG